MEPPQVMNSPAAAEPRLIRKGSVNAPTTREFPLYYKVRTKAVLRRAWRAVLENGTVSKSAETRKQVKLFNLSAEQTLDRIARQLRQETFQFSPSEGIFQKRPGKSPRPIVKSPIENRIVQRAVLDILQTESAIRVFYENPTSFGGIRGRGLGVPGTIASVIGAISKGCEFYIRSDIESFFTKIPRRIVLEKVRAVITDPKFQELLEKATTTELENLAALGKNAEIFPIYDVGVAQGCCLSPLIGNILLAEFDKAMNGRGIICLRYIDDFLILGSKQSSVIAAFQSAQRILSNYGLTAYDPFVNKGKAEIGAVKQGIEFLGCEITPGLITPSAKSRRRLMETLITLVQKSKRLMGNPRELAKKKRTMARTLEEMDNIIRGWGNQYSFCNNQAAKAELDKQITEITREYCCYVKQVMGHLSNESKTSDWRRLIGVHLLMDSKYDPIVKKFQRI